MPDYLQMVKAKEEEESALYARMDADRNLVYLKPFVLTDPKGKTVPDIVNVTLNKAAVFAANVISAMGAVKQQIIVESEKVGYDTSAVERFIEAALSAANYRLMKRGMPLLNPFADAQLCLRGRTARRVLFRQEEGEIVPDIMPWDGRYVTCEMGDSGPLWAAYSTVRRKSDIEAEYGITPNRDNAVVRDIWDSWHNEVWIDDNQVRAQEHGYGYTPVVVEEVPLGYGQILMDEDRIRYKGESIFFLVRDMVVQLNMLMSILQTLNLKLVKRPQQYASKEGPQAEPPEYEDATGMGKITSVDLGGGIIPVTYGDAQNAAQMAYGIIEKAIQEGGYTDIDVGNVRQPFSAVALITIGESKDQVYLPRLAAKENLNVQTAEMVLRQCRAIGGTLKLGATGHQSTWSAGKLDGEYVVNFRYFIKSPKTDIARMAVAQIAERYYPREYILSEVLQVEDVAGVLRQWHEQEAEMLSQNIKRHRVIMALLEEAERGDENAAVEAKILALELGVSLEMVKQGILNPAETGGKPPFQQAPMLGDGGQNGEGLPSLFGQSGNIGPLPPSAVSGSGQPTISKGAT